VPGRGRLKPAHLLRTVDLAGTALFALQGGLTAAAAGLDVFGVLVLGFVTAVGGGIVRDLLLGDTPPAVFRDLAYPLAAFGAGAVVVVLYAVVRDVPREVLVPLDAAALALFAVVGAAKAIDHRAEPAERASDRAELAERASDRAELAERASDRAELAERASERMRPLLAALLGTVSAVGGGVMRDILLGGVPLILRSDVYAVAALAGAAVTAVGLRRGGNRVMVLTAGAVVTVVIRLLAVSQGWNLPRVAG
jgi:uncharacterized membrane protein YeiH